MVSRPEHLQLHTSRRLLSVSTSRPRTQTHQCAVSNDKDVIFRTGQGGWQEMRTPKGQMYYFVSDFAHVRVATPALQY